MKSVKEIIGETNERGLREELNDLLNTEGVTYSDIEDLFLDYGLEMDYFEQMLF